MSESCLVRLHHIVMAGLGPAIHDFAVTGEDVDGRPAPAMTVWRAPALTDAFVSPRTLNRGGWSFRQSRLAQTFDEPVEFDSFHV